VGDEVRRGIAAGACDLRCHVSTSGIRVACTLAPADAPACARPAVVEIEDSEGVLRWGCAIHALHTLRAADQARIVRDPTVPAGEVTSDGDRS
jgi:hypothetical protein